MKRMALTLMACLLSGLSCMAQSIVTGTNLNIGVGNTLTSDAVGLRGHAIGRYNIVEAHNSLAVGYNDTIGDQSQNSLALGAANRIGGSTSFGIGQDVKVMGDYGLGIGRNLKATGERYCMIIGSGLYSAASHPKKYLENPYSHSLMIGFKSIHPTLTVGPSPNDYPQGDTLGKTGKVAIGNVPVPDIAAKLHIRSDYGEDAGILLEPKAPTVSNTFIRMRDEDHGIEVDNMKRMIITSKEGNQRMPILMKGTVGINIDENYYSYMITNVHYALFVHGGLITDRVAIKHYGLSTWWPDYVFRTDYHLMPLQELRKFINDNHHLPEVPSEAEVAENGIELGEMQSVLLKKIEEMTLYLLQQQETIEQLEHRIAELEGK